MYRDYKHYCMKRRRQRIPAQIKVERIAKLIKSNLPPLVVLAGVMLLVDMKK